MSVTDTPTQTSQTDLRQKTLIAAANGTALYLLAYLTAYAAYYGVTILTAQRLQIPGVLLLDRLQFLIPNSGWWQAAVVAVFGSGPVLCLLLAAVAGLWFWQRARRRRGLGKQYLMWLMLHGLNMFFGALVADTVVQNGFWFAVNYLLLLGNVVNVLVAVLFGLVLLVLGYLAAPVFLQSHDSRTLMRFAQRRRLLLATLFGPWAVGLLLLMLARFPQPDINELLRGATMLLMLVMVAVASTTELFEFTVPSPQKTRVAWGLVVGLGLLLLGLRLLLGGAGLRF